MDYSKLEVVDQARRTLIDLAIRYGPRLLSALFILIVGIVVIRRIAAGLAGWLTKREMEPPLRMLLVRLLSALLFLLVLMLALQNLGVELLPLFAGLEDDDDLPPLAKMPLDQEVNADYEATGLSLKAHPLGLVRSELDKLQVLSASALRETPDKTRVSAAKKRGQESTLFFFARVKPCCLSRKRCSGRQRIHRDRRLRNRGQGDHVQAIGLRDRRFLYGGIGKVHEPVTVLMCDALPVGDVVDNERRAPVRVGQLLDDLLGNNGLTKADFIGD